MARIHLSITMDEALLKWVDQHVKNSIEYKDRSHFIELTIHRYKKRVEAEKRVNVTLIS